MERQDGQGSFNITNDGQIEDIGVTAFPLRSIAGFVGRLLKEVIETILPGLVIAFLVTHFLGERTVVLGQSMEPNLYQNQQLIIDKLRYRFHGPLRGDIVVVEVRNSDIPYIKRVIGLAGEILEVRNNRVYIDGEVLSETYISEVMQGNFGPITIPDDHVFVMGDNRRSSRDSRTLGTIPVDDVLARAWFRVWPLEDFGLLN